MLIIRKKNKGKKREMGKQRGREGRRRRVKERDQQADVPQMFMPFIMSMVQVASKTEKGKDS